MKLQLKLLGAMLLILSGVIMTGCGGGETVVAKGTVNGRVVSAEGGAGIAGAGVIVGGKPGVTDPAGYYAITHVPLGPQAVVVTAAGYTQPGGPVLVQINPGDNYIPNIVLVPTGGEPPDEP